MSAYYGDEQYKQEFIGHAASLMEGDAALLCLKTGIPVELLEAAKSFPPVLPEVEGLAWPFEFASAVRVDADLSHSSFAMMEWLVADTHFGLLGLAKGPRTKSVLRLLAAYFGKTALHGTKLGQMQPGGELILAFAFLKREVALWSNWQGGSLNDWRASRAALELWKGRDMRPKDLARALMAVRAAYADAPECAAAQARAFKTLVSLEPMETHLGVYSKVVNG